MDLNRNIILFIYGLVFFTLGITLALQSRSYSRLDLARSLKWLAAFGLAHGLYEWGELLLPIQASNMSQATHRLWMGFQLVLLAFSFACLFEFGLSLLRLRGRWRLVMGLPWLLWLGWLVLTFAVLLPSLSDWDTWRNTSNALARYFISFPAGLLAAASLYLYTRRSIAPLEAPHISRMLHLASLALFIYAFLSGLVPPPVPFFPGNWLNTQTFNLVMQLPVRVFRSAVGLILTISMIRALEIFDLEYARRLEAIEKQQVLSTERERLARELHDGAIQTVYTAGLLVESVYRMAEPGSQQADRLERAVGALDNAVQDLRRNLGELAGSSSTLPLDSALTGLAQDPRFSHFVEIKLNLDLPDVSAITPVNTAHVLAIVREALANVIRHSHAHQVSISACQRDGLFCLLIEDDGIGMRPDAPRGYGLRNMRDRARLLGGTLVWENRPERGLALRLEFPWNEDR